MTDETPESGDVSSGDSAPAETASEATEGGAAEHAAVEPAAPVSFWHRPNVERYLMPLFIPIVVAIGLVVYVLNISRIFLSAHGHIAVAVGSAITVTILIGATVLSNSKRLQSSSITLMSVGFVLVVLASGWLVLGHSQVKGGGETSLPAQGPCDGSFTITALPTIKFEPTVINVKTGIYCVTFKDQATSHTLDFDDPSTLWTELVVSNPGETKTGRIYFGKASDYTYFCAIPGHRVTMNGVVKVTGDPITVADAEAKGKPAAG